VWDGTECKLREEKKRKERKKRTDTLQVSGDLF
jgi:hypothetical protein